MVGSGQLPLSPTTDSSPLARQFMPHVGTLSRVAQWKRAGPITQRSEDRNLALLEHVFCPSLVTSLADATQAAVVAEWLRRLTRNQFPAGSVGSSPTDCVPLCNSSTNVLTQHFLFSTYPQALVRSALHTTGTGVYTSHLQMFCHRESSYVVEKMSPHRRGIEPRSPA